MIRQPWMTIVAGDELLTAMEAEQRAIVPETGSGFKSEALCALQRKQAARGILGAEIVDTFYGFSVRYDSGLQNWGLLASCNARQLDGSFEAAAEWAKAWVAQDPDRRYAWSSK